MPLSNPIPVGNVAVFRLTPEDADGVSRPVVSGSLLIEPYSAAYVAKIETNRFIVVPRAVAMGASVPVTLTVTAAGEFGGPVEPLVLNFSVEGEPFPPQATQIVITEGVTVRPASGFITPPPDPGSDTIDL